MRDSGFSAKTAFLNRANYFLFFATEGVGMDAGAWSSSSSVFGMFGVGPRDVLLAVIALVVIAIAALYRARRHNGQAASLSAGWNIVRAGFVIMAISGATWLIQGEKLDDSLQQNIGNNTSQSPPVGGFGNQFEDTFAEIRKAQEAGRVMRYAAVGFFVGLFVFQCGVVKLFLDKQAVFEQHVGQQLNIQESKIEGAVQMARDTFSAGQVGAMGPGAHSHDSGDRTNVTGDVIGSAVGREAAVHARDITVYQRRLDEAEGFDAQLKQTLAAANEAINRLSIPDDDKAEVTSALGKLTDELAKSSPEQSRVARYLANIRNVSPSVEQILVSDDRILTGKQMEALRDALCAAFDPESFDQMLRLRLDKDRAQLVAADAFQTVVFKVIDLAYREGWVMSLVEAAAGYNPGNVSLKRFRDEHIRLPPRATGS